MTQALILAALASFALLSQAIPRGAVLDETFADVVELPSLKREEGNRVYTLDAFGKKIVLDLERTHGLLPAQLPVYVYGEDADGNPTMEDWTHRTDSFQGLYTDKQRGASVMVEDVEGEIKISGLLGGGLVIEPVRDIELHELVDNDLSEVPEVSRLRHLVSKVADDVEGNLGNFEKKKEDDPEKRAVLPETLYVPVQVVVDYGLWKKLARTEDEVIKYVKQFYNSVQQYFNKLSWPSVSVSIYGITICKTAAACIMIERLKRDSNTIDANTVLGDIATYAYEQRPTIGTDYAAMMVMTGYQMCQTFSTDGTCNKGIISAAPLGGACGRYENRQNPKIGIVEDQGVFHSVKFVVNKIGRLLGMNNDGEALDPTDFKHMRGTPGAEECNAADGHIMGDLSVTDSNTDGFTWSHCSVEQLRWFSKQKQARCLHVVPQPSIHPPITKPPGSELGLDNQCKVLFGSTSKVQCTLPGFNKGNDQICKSLACAVSPTTCQSQGPPADGSYCGPQRHCLQGKCVCDPNAPQPTAVPRDPSCKGDHFWLEINGKSCVELLTSVDGLEFCNSDDVRENCCESVAKYCKPDPVSCDGLKVVTQKPTPPDQIFTLAPTTTKKPYTAPSDINCGKSCSDNPQVRIDGKDCASLLATTDDKVRLCDNPVVTQHCCATRSRVCRGYLWTTPSCDNSCVDNPKVQINSKKCVPLLQTTEGKEDFCEENLVKKHCCATVWKVCPHDTPFGR